MPYSSFMWRRSRSVRISSIGNGAGSRSSAASALPGSADLAGVLVAVAQLRREVGTNSLSITSRAGERLEPVEDLGEERAVVGRRCSIAYVPCSRVTNSTPTARRAGRSPSRQVGQAADQQRVPGAQHVGGGCAELGERDHEGRGVLAAVGLGRRGIDEVQHDGRRGPAGRSA